MTRLLRLSATALATLLLGGAVGMGQLSLQAARSVVNPARVVGTATPLEYGLAYEAVEFPSVDGLRLRGWFIPGGRAAIILTHGHASSKASMLEYAAFLRRDGGYSVLLFDFRASGESEGAEATLGYNERRDIVGAMGYLNSRRDVDPNRLGALGGSMGAAALLLLGADAHPLKAMVADSSFATGDSLVSRFDRWFRLPSAFFSAAVPWAIERLSGLKPGDVAPLDTVGAIAPTPLLLIHGELDPGIPVTDAYALYEKAGEPKELWVIPDAGHGGYGLVREEYERRVLAFFAQYLNPP